MLNKNRLFVFLLGMVLLFGSPAGIRDVMAVSLSSTGTGETLLFPYYTVRNGYDTYLSLTNTTSSGKAVRINFREGLGGKLVLGFNAYLAANDQWAAAVVATSDGARMYVADKTCTAPQIPEGGVNLVNYAYANPPDVFGITSWDRTRDGYFEVIEMGQIPSGSQFAANITPVNGVPKDCPWVNSLVFDTQSNGTQFVQGGGTCPERTRWRVNWQG